MISFGTLVGVLWAVSCRSKRDCEQLLRICFARNVIPAPHIGEGVSSDRSGKRAAVTFKGIHAPPINPENLAFGARLRAQVFDDANLDSAVDGAMAAKFRFGGQACIAPNRFMVQEGIHNAFVASMAERMRSLRVGDGLDSRTSMGPLINRAARDKVKC